MAFTGYDKAMPLLCANLVAEMVFVLHQRLSAQNIEALKSARVLQEVILHAYSAENLDRWMKPQRVPSINVLRSSFDAFAQCSIMALNETSLRKLFDLISMTLKLQLLSLSSPFLLMDLTLNHIDYVLGLLQGSSAESAVKHLSTVAVVLKNYIESLTSVELFQARNAMLSLFKDRNIKVSMFLTAKQQKSDGHFVRPCGASVPAYPRIYQPPGIIHTIVQRNLVDSSSFQVSVVPRGKLAGDGVNERRTALGRNCYFPGIPPADALPRGISAASVASPKNNQKFKAGLRELELLGNLVHTQHAPTDVKVTFELFTGDAAPAAPSRTGEELVIDLGNLTQGAELKHLMNELKIDDTTSQKVRCLGVMGGLCQFYGALHLAGCR